MKRFAAAATTWGLLGLSALPTQVLAFRFGDGDVKGSFDSTISLGGGVRTKGPSAGLVVQGNSGGPEGQASLATGFNDQGNLNYRAGDFYTAYVKGSHELLVNLPQQVSFMARGTWLRDFAATHTSGYVGGIQANVADPSALEGGLTADARRELRFKARMLDLWVSKKFEIGEQRAQVRVGNQVINWGESLFIAGGLNSTNSVDLQRLSLPGTQIKEALLPAPMISASSSLGAGFSTEVYLQRKWVDNYSPPVGSYWSLVSGGAGHEAYGAVFVKPRDRGQWGASLRYEPAGTAMNFGLYALTYHDRLPLFTYDAFHDGSFVPGFRYAERRRAYGASVNFSLGEWAFGSELSYRPNDTVLLHSGTGSFCMERGGDCWTEGRRYQWHVNAIQSLTPSNSRDVLDFIGAQGGSFMAEFVAIRYPGLTSKLLPGEVLAAGAWSWGQEFDASAPALSKGTATSTGLAMDLSFTYDGTLLPGFQVTPELYYTAALTGYTPNGTFLRGAQAATATVTFVRIPATWQFGISYAKFWGGSSLYSQPYRDRDTVGAYASLNF